MADIKDSPVSQLSATAELSAQDLFLVSKRHEEADGVTWTSNGINVNDTVSSFINYMTGPLSSYLSSHLSSFTSSGTVTLKEWTYVPANE